jgi:hypothetical protein
LFSVKDLLTLVDAPFDESADNPAISQASPLPSAAVVSAAPARVGPATSSKLHTATVRPGSIDARALFVPSMQSAVEAAETAFNLTCVDTIEAVPKIDYVMSSWDPVESVGDSSEDNMMRGFGNISSLVLLMRRLERQWSRLKRYVCFVSYIFEIECCGID